MYRLIRPYKDLHGLQKDFYGFISRLYESFSGFSDFWRLSRGAVLFGACGWGLRLRQQRSTYSSDFVDSSFGEFRELGEVVCSAV